jgi:[ribosomal protein S5]-alanine N-acetyltransferase
MGTHFWSVARFTAADRRARVLAMPSPPPRPNIPVLSELYLTIETARLALRPLTDGDVDALWPYVSDPEFPKYMSWTAHTDKAQTREFIARVTAATANNEGVTWAIVHEGAVIGTVGLDRVQWQMRAWRIDRAELGYWIAPPMWGKGLVTEAAHAVVTFGFENLGLHKITVGCIAENTASRRVIEKVGFRYIGRLEDDVWRDGRWWSHLRYELTSPEWPDVHTTIRVSRPRPA